MKMENKDGGQEDPDLVAVTNRHYAAQGMGKVVKND